MYVTKYVLPIVLKKLCLFSIFQLVHLSGHVLEQLEKVSRNDVALEAT